MRLLISILRAAPPTAKADDKIEKERETYPFPLQKTAACFAFRAKTSSQIIIGVGIFILLLLKVMFKLTFSLSYACPSTIVWWNKLLSFAMCNSTLNVVAKGLAISAGVELAYMLFTPGPDEAIEPIILGIASAVLLLVSQPGDIGWPRALGAFVLILTMALLFLIRARYHLGDNNPCKRHQDENRIRERAYHLWEKEGRQEGRSDEYWERARRALGSAGFFQKLRSLLGGLLTFFQF